MGCGASSAASAKAPDAAPAVPASFTPPPRDAPESEWCNLVPKPDLSEVTMGANIPAFYLCIHDNQADDAPRLTVVSLQDGSLEPVRIKDRGRGLAAARGLECLWLIDAKAAGKEQDYYATMESGGNAWLFKLSRKRGQWVAHGVKQFAVAPPPGAAAEAPQCEGARCFVDEGRLWLEYASRGGRNGGTPVTPWVARHPFDVKAVRKGRWQLDPGALEVTYWPQVDNDPDVRQCADLGHAPGMARYGQLFAAAYDDPEHETHFRSYILERLPGAQAGGVENCKPLFIVRGGKIEAIHDLTRDLTVFATDDEGRGATLTLLHRHSGAAWRIAVQPPEGEDPRLYGVSGIAPVDPSVTKQRDSSSSEEESEAEEEEEEGDQGRDRDRDNRDRRRSGEGDDGGGGGGMMEMFGGGEED
ncbi:hypothetical protein HYH03_012432 [Edaphochlamys debaryana]|uniref:Uncharacterized protein n=1 Tax=Edaphochlamys debaryana TaxID=47281 RepID=A0A835XSS0_9CHLO|nr:hypothetical protein HYH03_012432 [Edaphochlamys debaryana]|eukprot:KAG2488992.1 hypothetical protein HYH03_012432 [Edaphochlamys debaryana]